MSAGTAVAVINYISQIFTPVESLGMEIQTIQSAIAGVHRINEFYALEELPEHVRNQKETCENADAAGKNNNKATKKYLIFIFLCVKNMIIRTLHPY